MPDQVTTSATDDSNNSSKHKLGLIALVAIVISSMLGGGVFSLPSNTSEVSAIGPIFIAWIIAGIGVYFIANSFRLLSDIRPDLQAGVYMYAQEGFGKYIGFNVAWGYWLMTALGNVSFAVILMDAINNQFFPGIFTGGNNMASIICGSVLIWGYNFLVLSGTKISGLINIVGTIAKLIPLVAFVIILGFMINYSELFVNIWGTSPQITEKIGDTLQPISISSQILAPMTVTLWAFIGVEGAVVLSGRAQNKKDVGKATLIGFLLALTIYMCLSLLPFGVLPQAELAQVNNPSTAGVLDKVVGSWGEFLMNIGLILSVLASWLAWTMLCAEIPMVAAQKGTFPKILAKTNKKQAANVSLWVSSFIMQIAMLLVHFSHDAWTTMYNISALMVIPAYITTTLYMVKICINRDYDKYASSGRKLALVGGILGTLFCLFILYASQIIYMALIPILLTCGLPLFIWAQKENNATAPIFNKKEIKYLAILLVLDAIILISLFSGILVI